LAVGGGFAEVNSDKISVLASVAETPSEVNLEQARAEREEAEKALVSSANSPINETEDLRDRIDFANARLRLAGR